MSANRLKKLWKPNQRNATDFPSDVQHQLCEGSNSIKGSNLLSSQNPGKPPERKNSRTRRSDVKPRTGNLGKLIGLWKRLESLDKENDPSDSEKSTLPSRNKSTEEAPAENKNGDARDLQGNLPLSEDITATQNKENKKTEDNKKHHKRSIVNEIVRKNQEDIENNSIQNVIESQKTTVEKLYVEQNDSKNEKSDNTLFEASENSIDTLDRYISNRTSAPIPILKSELPEDSSEKKNDDTNCSPSEEISQNNSRVSSLRKNDSKRHSLRRRKLLSAEKNLAADFSDIFQRISVHSVDFPNILQTSALIQESGDPFLTGKLYGKQTLEKESIFQGNREENGAYKKKTIEKTRKYEIKKSLSFNDSILSHRKVESVNRVESTKSGEAWNTRRKRLLRKPSTSSTESASPIVEDKNVKNILQRLSVNYVEQPLLRSTTEEMEIMDLMEKDHRRKDFERRLPSHGKNRNVEGSNKQQGITPSTYLFGGDSDNGKQDSHELDQMIAIANEASLNNLSSVSGQKYKAMLSQSNSCFNSIPAPVKSTSKISYEAPAEKTVSSPRSRRTGTSPLNSPVCQNRTSAARFLKSSSTIDKPTCKSSSPIKPREVGYFNAKIAESDKNVDKSGKSGVGEENLQSFVRSKSELIGNFDRRKTKSLPQNLKHRMSSEYSLKTFQRNSEWLDKIVTEAVKNQQHLPLEMEHQKSTDFLEVGLPPLQTGTQKSSFRSEIIKSNNELDSIDRSEYILSEPIEIPKRKIWLEGLIRKNSGKSKSTRLNKCKSMCDLKFLSMSESFSDELAEAGFTEEDGYFNVRKTVQESVEDITASIDKENRGKAYMLPSDLRKRRSLYCDNSNIIGEDVTVITTVSESSSVCSDNQLDNTTTRLTHQSESDIVSNLEKDSPNIKLPNIKETAILFLQKASLSNAKQTRPRPKSYGGELIGKSILSDKALGVSDEKSAEMDKETSNTTSILGSLLISNNTEKSNSGVTKSENNPDNPASVEGLGQLSRNDSGNRDSFRNNLILQDIAENQKREQEFRDSRVLQFFDIADKDIDIDDLDSDDEVETKSKQKYPSSLKSILHENGLKR